jgi:hypothetical protein
MNNHRTTDMVSRPRPVKRGVNDSVPAGFSLPKPTHVPSPVVADRKKSSSKNPKAD